MRKILSLFSIAALLVGAILVLGQPKAAEAFVQGVGHVKINVAGAGYVLNDAITVTGGNADATLEVTAVSGLGAVTGLRITNIGSGYSNATAVATTGGTGAGLTVDISITNGIKSISLNSGLYPNVLAGSGYVGGDICKVDNSAGTNTMDARVEVLTVGGTGDVLTARVTVAGTGYAGGYYYLVDDGLGTCSGNDDAAVYVDIITGAGPAAGVANQVVVTQNVVSEITITAPVDILMNPDIPGMSGGMSSGNVYWDVITNDTSGYNMTIQSVGSPALRSATASFADYSVLAAPAPDAAWTVAAANSAFGFTVEVPVIDPLGADTGPTNADGDAPLFLDDDDADLSCGDGAANSATNNCWLGLTGAPVQIVNRITDTGLGGERIPLTFRAEVGASHYQQEGAYTATIMVTATTN